MKNKQLSLNLHKRALYFLQYGMLLIMICMATPAYSVVFDPVFGTKVDDLQVPINQSRILIFDDVIQNISVGNPLVADVLVLESRKIYVVDFDKYLKICKLTSNFVTLQKSFIDLHQD